MTVTVLLTMPAQLLLASAGFFVQQQAAMIALIIAFIMTIAVFAQVLWGVLQRLTVWQQDGVLARAYATLGTLGITARVTTLGE